MKFDVDVGDIFFLQIYLETANLAKTGEEHRTLYKRTSARFIVASEINLHCKNICATLSSFYIMDSVM